MRQFAAVPVPGREPVRLAVKAAVASGPARRFVVGDPAIQRKAVLAGATVTRMAVAEHLAGKGEVVVDEATAAALGERAECASGVWMPRPARVLPCWAGCRARSSPRPGRR